MTFPHIPGDTLSLVHELSAPIPPLLKDKFFKRVAALLSGCDTITPGHISGACAKAQAELLNAPAVDEKPSPSRSRRKVHFTDEGEFAACAAMRRHVDAVAE